MDASTSLAFLYESYCIVYIKKLFERWSWHCVDVKFILEIITKFGW